MLVKEILGECLVKMGSEDFTSAAERTETQQTLIGRLLAAFNIAYREAVTEYLPLVAEEEVEVRDGEIPAASLGRKIIYPLSLVSEGRHCRIRTYPDRVVTDLSGKGVLRYAYLPPELAEDDEIGDMRLTSSVLSDGTLAELYYQDKVFDLAQSFDTDFRAALGVLRYKGRALRLKAGRW